MKKQTKKTNTTDLGEEWFAARHSLSRFNNHEDQARGADISKAKEARDDLQKTLDAAAAEIKEKTAALLKAIGE